MPMPSDLEWFKNQLFNLKHIQRWKTTNSGFHEEYVDVEKKIMSLEEEIAHLKPSNDEKIVFSLTGTGLDVVEVVPFESPSFSGVAEFAIDSV